MGSAKSMPKARTSRIRIISEKPLKPPTESSSKDQVLTKKSTFRRQRSSRINRLSKQKSVVEELQSASEVAITSSDRTFLSKSLRRHFLFEVLPGTTIEVLISKFKLFNLAKDASVFSKGDLSFSMFILKSGKLDAKIKPGEAFGERALIEDAEREFTLKALKNSQVFKLDRVSYLKAIKSMNVDQVLHDFPIVQALPADLLHALDCIKLENREKLYAEDFYIIKKGKVRTKLRDLEEGDFFGDDPHTVVALSSVVLLSFKLTPDLLNCIYRYSCEDYINKNKYLKYLSDEHKTQIANAMKISQFADSETVIPFKSTRGNNIWVVLKGSVVTELEETMGIGHIVGDEDLFEDRNGQYGYSVLAKGETVLAQVSKSEIESIVKSSIHDTIYTNRLISVLSSIRLLESLPMSTIHKMAKEMTILSFEEASLIFREGEASFEFYIIKSGEVQVYKNDNIIRKLESLSYFGERGIILNEPRTATVVANKQTECWVLSREIFLSIIDERMQAYLSRRMLLQDDTIELKDLYSIKELGNGSFGNVILTANSKNSNLYALKSISRKKIETFALRKYLLIERRILIQLDHPMIMKMVKTFKDSERIYFLLEYVQGKDFFDVLRDTSPLNDSAVMFYTACMILMLEYLHSKKILYRDLKPENIIIDEDGYPKLIDFGASAIVKGRTFTKIGTAQYMAPEVIRGQGYSFSADVWTLGILLYELVTGKLPFGNSSQNSVKVYEDVINKKIKIPKGPFSHLISLFLNRNPHDRVFNQYIKKQECFAGLDWDSLLTRALKAPYIPKTKPLNLPKLMKKQKDVPNFTKKLEKNDKKIPKTSKPINLQDDWDKEF